MTEEQQNEMVTRVFDIEFYAKGGHLYRVMELADAFARWLRANGFAFDEYEKKKCGK